MEVPGRCRPEGPAEGTRRHLVGERASRRVGLRGGSAGSTGVRMPEGLDDRLKARGTWWPLLLTGTIVAPGCAVEKR